MTGNRPSRPWYTQPYDNSEASRKRFHYIEKDHEQPLAIDKLNYDQVGALLETYVDALHLALVMDEPRVNRKLMENPAEIGDVTFFLNDKKRAPSFIFRALGDYRGATSFFRNDRLMVSKGPWAQSKQPASADFAHVSHAQLRKVATNYGAQFELQFFPPSHKGNGEYEEVPPKEDFKRFKEVQKAVGKFQNLQKEYGKLYADFSARYKAEQAAKAEGMHEKESARITKAKEKQNIFSALIKSDEFTHIEGRLRESIDTLVRALSPRDGRAGIDQFYLKHVDGTYLTIDNTQKTVGDFSLAYPAFMILSLASKGKHDVDQSVASKEIFDLFTQVIGVESQITENLQKLHDDVIMPKLREKGVIPDNDLLYGNDARTAFIQNIKNHVRGIQLLYSFHKTAGQLERIYPAGKENIAYRDMERLLDAVGVKTRWVDELQTPSEVATMLYAIEKRMSLAGQETFSLRELTNEIGKCGSFEKVKVKDRNDLEQWLKTLPDEPAKNLITATLDKMTGKTTDKPERNKSEGQDR